jgi:nucleoside-diphosphate-sugar epimerase
VLLLGGAGFIGFSIVSYLCKFRIYDITIADNFFRGKKDEPLIKLISEYNIKVFQADFTLPTSFDKLDDNYDFVYMLASVVGVDYTSAIPNEIIRINTALIFNTLEWLKNSKCKKVLFSSTSECYAGTIDAFNYKIPTPEEVPLCINDIKHPRFTYAVTKMLGESGFHNYSKVFGFENVIVRYHNVYGPRMGFKHVIPHLAQRFLKKENPFKIYGHDQTRAFCYIEDAVVATVLAMEKGIDGETYHIGTEEEVTIDFLIREAGNYFNYKGEYEIAPTYPGSVARRCPDISKAKRELGYIPKVNLNEGLRLTLNWYENYIVNGNEIYE